LNTVAEYYEKQSLPPELDVALIDEGQDLSSDVYQLPARTASHVTVFADYAQQLYAQVQTATRQHEFCAWKAL